MRIGIFVENQATGRGGGTVDDYVERVRNIADAGFPAVWSPQVFGLDALTAIAVAGREVTGVEFGTAVVPTFPRHATMLAQQARTAQLATGGRLTLGIGLSHQVVVEGMWGYSFDRPARHMREYLSILLPLLREGSVNFQGETMKGIGQLRTAEPDPVPVLLAALAPRMLELAGGVADGTVTWMTGPKTVASHIAPAITRAAQDADREAPRIVVALPTAVTDDPDGAREAAGKAFAGYGQLPSYRAMLDKEGAEGPADVAIVGDAASVRAQVEQVFEAGATEFVGVPFQDVPQTLDVLAGML